MTSETERLRIDSSGRLLVGTSSASTLRTNVVPRIQTETTSANENGISLFTNVDSSSSPFLILGKSRGTTVGSNTLVADDDGLGTIMFIGADGSDRNSSGAAISAFVDGAPGTNDMPGRLVFSTTADGASSATERMRIDSSGRVGIGTTSPKRLLHLDGGSGGVQIQLTNDTTGKTTDGDGFQLQLASDGTARVTQRENLALAFDTNNTERLRIDSSGRLGLGTSTPSAALHVISSNAGGYGGVLYNTSSTGEGLTIRAGSTSSHNILIAQNYDGSATSFIVNAAGNVGIGTTSPVRLWHALDSANSIVGRVESGQSSSWLQFAASGTGTASRIGDPGGSSNAGLAFMTADTERARIDSSGRLLVGTSTAPTDTNNGPHYSKLISVGNTASASGDGRLALCRGNTAANLSSGNNIGGLYFGDSAGGTFASISVFADATPGTNDYPGRLVFSTTADGASSPTERMRLKSDGVLISCNTSQTTSSTPSEDSTINCVAIRGSQGQIQISAQNTIAFDINRRFSDGTLVNFRHDGTVEGTISVSGTTVSYNGAHLARWSQLPGGVERTEILRGSVLSNIDEMCDWGEEDNEQLNRMKVSDVEGDRNVSGVFQGWDDDDDTYTNDFYCAMTGDFVIRIAQGVTVERGDLLMSAGDGTAKPQDDDIIRSKTIAKVTSTHVSETYADGSYCVPCVLMAC